MVALSSVAGVRISIDKGYWPELAQVTDAPDAGEHAADLALWPRIIGTITKWAKKGEALRIKWYDGLQTNELKDMVDPDFNMRFEKYLDGRDPPHGRGENARGVPPPVADAPADAASFKATYTFGQPDRELTWTQVCQGHTLAPISFRDPQIKGMTQ